MKTTACLIAVFFSACLFSQAQAKSEEKFKPAVESLQAYECPEWFRDAKFGIYLHWGAYSVAERGEWYARKLYDETTPEYKHHLETYGHPSERGYVDFIPEWKAENFDPDALLALFKRSGAKYFTPCAVHHDNFDLWNSKHHEWNAVNMGPKKDLIQMWKDATKLLEDVGAWFDVNGEGIYGTRPWYLYGEGKTEMPHTVIESPFTSSDIRYTTKGEYLYAFVLDWPGKKKREVNMEFLAPMNHRIGEIKSVELLGYDGAVEWEQNGDGLLVQFPDEKTCEFAYGLKIHLPKK